jgi:hypothetical protein
MKSIDARWMNQRALVISRETPPAILVLWYLAGQAAEITANMSF